MDSTIRRTLWVALITTIALVVFALADIIAVLRSGVRHEQTFESLQVLAGIAVTLLGLHAVWRIERALRIPDVQRVEATVGGTRLKDEFLSIASHELRTPVTSIKGYTQLAKALIRENDLSTAEEFLEIALDQIDRMSRLILELLDVSRIETGRLEIRREPIDWVAFVREFVQRRGAVVNDRRCQLLATVPCATVVGDRDRLEQVLGNLLENAVKYSPDGSEITVRIELGEDRIVTTVSDRGMGIPPDELGQVFERFHRGRQVSTTNYGGLGLGLYIARQIVDRHGGTISVESREGVGTSFTFALPAAGMPATLEAPRQREQRHEASPA